MHLAHWHVHTRLTCMYAAQFRHLVAQTMWVKATHCQALRSRAALRTRDQLHRNKPVRRITVISRCACECQSSRIRARWMLAASFNTVQC